MQYGLPRVGGGVVGQATRERGGIGGGGLLKVCGWISKLLLLHAILEMVTTMPATRTSTA